MGASSGGGLRAPATAGKELSVPSVAMVGASYRTAGVASREVIAKRLSGLRGSDFERGEVFESAALETCNRLELYFVAYRPDGVSASAIARLGGAGAPPGTFYVKTGIDAVRHIFRVASGLDSPVLGEEQILEQVRDAGRTARKAGRAKSILSPLFDAACSSARRIRGSYEAPPANRSVSAFALDHAVEELGHPPGAVLLIGSGETAKFAALRLKGSAVYLLSARRGLEGRFPTASRITRRRLREVTEKCDLVIAATRRRGYALTRRDLPEARKMVVLDLGFPRNVDPCVRSSELIRLYDLDSVAEWALSSGPRENAPAEMTLEAEARSFDAWLRASRLTPTLANIYRWGERIREEETLTALRKLPDLSTREKAVIESLSKRLTGKLLSPHASFVKDVGDGADQSERLLLLESIFRDGKR